MKIIILGGVILIGLWACMTVISICASGYCRLNKHRKKVDLDQ